MAITINRLVTNSIVITTGPAGHAETRITFYDGSSGTYEWSGTINRQTMIDAGLFDEDEYTWTKKPVTVDIGNTVTTIGTGAFEMCHELTSVTMPNSVTSIGNNAFLECRGLTSVTIPDSVTVLDECAFDTCESLTNITIPNSVTSIGNWAFNYCTGLTSVTIPDSVTSIGYDAFTGCEELTSVTITANGGNAQNVKSMLISSGVDENIIIMPS